MAHAPSRFYVIDIDGAGERLVNARRAAEAKSYVIGSRVGARVATQDDLVRLVRQGAPVEYAAPELRPLPDLIPALEPEPAPVVEYAA